MASLPDTAESAPIVSRDRVIDVLRTELRVVVTIERRLTVEQISSASGVGVRTVRSYMANDALEVREASLSNALSIAVVLGSRAINSVLALVGYGGAHPLDEPDEPNPMLMVARTFSALSVITNAAADGRFDHIELPDCQKAADVIIAEVLPLSSAGRAV